MMQHLRNPKNVKLVSLFIAAIFVLGCFALSVTQSGFSKMASAAASESAIGVVNFQMVVTQSPELAKVRTAMQEEVKNAQKDFETKSASMNDQEKQQYYQQLQERLANKEKELMDPLMKGIEDAIKKVADKKGLSVVVEKSTVVYGGVDITDEVAKSLQTAKK
ncbi:MAG: OmpH family outer membrane protein [Phascolarctobacterium sp.]|nr:OmpH family outer membrane protein [Phascolarctobacterium sp.]